VTVTDAPADDDLRRALHRTIAGVRDDMEGLRFNTAIAKLIELNNALTLHAGARGAAPREVMEPLVQMLAPLCPHLACELWERLGRTEDLTYAPFPVADPAWLATDTIEVPVQVNGKVRARVVAPAGADDDALRDLALADERVRAALGGAAPRKVIVVPGRLVNLVV
jgi:leucyl-tRNA synthetase